MPNVLIRSSNSEWWASWQIYDRASLSSWANALVCWVHCSGGKLPLAFRVLPSRHQYLISGISGQTFPLCWALVLGENFPRLLGSFFRTQVFPGFKVLVLSSAPAVFAVCPQVPWHFAIWWVIHHAHLTFYRIPIYSSRHFTG